MAAIPYSEMQPALAVLSNYHWSENVRELENVIERLVAISAQRMIGVDELPLDVVTVKHQVVDGVLTRGASLRQAKAEFERHYILRALEKSRWHQTEATKRLGIHRNTLLGKWKPYVFASTLTKTPRLLRQPHSLVFRIPAVLCGASLLPVSLACIHLW